MRNLRSLLMSRTAMRSSCAALLAALVLLPVACNGDSTEAGDRQAAPAATIPDSGPIAGVYPVTCGCVVEDVGMCGNYIAIEGRTVPLAGDIGLGKMEFCGQSGLEAKVEGQVVDGKFVAQTFELAP